MTKDSLLRALNKKIDIRHFTLMDIIVKEDNIEELWTDINIRGWREALIKKKYIQEIDKKYVLADLGLEIYKELCNLATTEVVVTEKMLENDFDKYCKDLMEEVNNKILKATGAKKLVLGSGSMYNSTPLVFKERLLSYSTKFNDTNYKNIRRAILSYTDDILTNKIKYPRKLYYFLWKIVKQNGKDILVSDLKEYIETLVEEKEAKSTKDYF